MNNQSAGGSRRSAGSSGGSRPTSVHSQQHAPPKIHPNVWPLVSPNRPMAGRSTATPSMRPSGRPTSNVSKMHPSDRPTSSRDVDLNSGRPLSNISKTSSRAPASPNMNPSGRPVTARNVDLNSSQFSQHSSSSVGSVNLGGRDYHVGSRVGSSGLFVIGDPASASTSVRSSHTEIAPSTIGSQRALVIEGSYDFEHWNWPAIRCACLAVVIAVSVMLLLGVTGISIKQQYYCQLDIPWWHGVVLYRVSVPTFYDSDLSGDGDFKGIIKKMTYFDYLGVKIISLSQFLPSSSDMWDEPSSFTDVDHRLGELNDLDLLISEIHDEGSKVLFDWSVSHTSTFHPWFQDSHRQVGFGDSIYRNFYIWKDKPDKYFAGGWEFDIQRDQGYLYRNYSSKPLLDWNNRDVHSEFLKAMEFWLKRGIDGFVVRDLHDMFIYHPSMMVSIFTGWRQLLDSYHNEKIKNGRKLLMVESSYLEAMRTSEPDLFPRLFASADLVEHSLGLRPALEGLPPTPLSPPFTRDIAQGLRWQQGEAWVVWRVVNMTAVAKIAPALQLLALSLPGTPAVTAGMEVAKYEDGANRDKLLLWKYGTIFPYSPDRSLNDTHILAMHALITARITAQSLRRDTDDEDENEDTEKSTDADTKEFNYEILDTTEDVVLLKRSYQQHDDYYTAANLGSVSVTRDWSDVTLTAEVIADTTGKLTGQYVSLHNVKLAIGQAIVFSVAK